MRAIKLVANGGPEVLEIDENMPMPVLGRHDVMIRVGAAGVNNTDINTRIGWYAKSDGDGANWSGDPFVFPRVQGADVCGEIVEVGADIDPARIGERVLVEPCLRFANDAPLKTPWYFGSEVDGGFAEFTKVASIHAHAIQTTLTDIELASFPCSYSTAENLLTRAGVGAADTVLVTGASGGVGSAAVQLAKARGATVIAITSPAKAEALTKIGASRILSRDDDPIAVLGENAVDVVIDLVAGDGFAVLLQVLRPKGRYAVSGAVGGAMVDLDVRTLYLKDLSFFGCTVLEPEVFPNLIARIERGEIKPLVARTFPLTEIAQAQTSFQEKSYIGKIVLEVNH